MDIHKLSDGQKELIAVFHELSAPAILRVARLLGVKLIDGYDEQNKPLLREADQILTECLEAFEQMNRKERRALIRFARKQKESKHGTST